MKKKNTFPSKVKSAKRNNPQQSAIRNTILAQMFGAPPYKILFEGGVVSLLVIILGGSELEIGIIFMIFNICMIMGIFIVPYLEVRSRKQIILKWRLFELLSVILFFLFFLSAISSVQLMLSFILCL